MDDAHTERDASLSDFLVTRARRSSDARLALDVAAGFVVAIAGAFWGGPFRVVITSAAGCFLAYGAWGIVDRELLERRGSEGRGVRALRLARVVAAIVGTLAAVMLLVSGLAVALGPVKS
jgi:hypothetical protein